MPLAGKGNMELCLLDSGVSGSIFLKVCDQFLWGRLAECTECAEVLHFEHTGNSFRYFTFIVTDCVEVRASG